MRGARAALVLLLLFATPALAQLPAGGFWTQQGGDVGHAGIAPHAVDSIDVRTALRVTREGETLPTHFGMGAVETRHGVALLAFDASTRTCTLVTAVEDATVARGAPLPCPHAWRSFEGTTVVGYDEARDLVFACLLADLDDPVLVALRATDGTVAWSVTPRQAGATLPTPSPEDEQPDREASGGRKWYCNNPAIDAARGRVVLPLALFALGGTIASVSIDDGATQWTRKMIAASPVETPLPSAQLPLLEREAAGLAYSATVSDTGVVVFGLQGSMSSLSWYDHDGAPRGSYAYASRPSPSGSINAIAGFPAQGGIVASVMGDRLILVDPLARAPTLRPAEAPPVREITGADSSQYGLNAAWFASSLVAPFEDGAYAYDVATGETLWTWDDPAGWSPSEALVLPPDEVLVVAALDEPEGRRVGVHRLSLAAGELLQRIEAPVGSMPEGLTGPDRIFTGRALPLRDGRLFLVSPLGDAAFLGPPMRPVPALSVDDAYPAAGQEVTLDAEGDPAVARLSVAWGDGQVDETEPGAQLSHAYASEGLREIRVTAVYVDGTTATSSTSAHVGAPEPPRTLLEQAFSAERAELSYFVIGLVVTGVGAAGAYYARRRRRSRIAADLAILDGIRRDARQDLPAAVARLGRFREQIADDLAGGRIDDGQFSTLELAALRLLQVLRQRVLGTLSGRVSVRFEQALDVALQDGRLEPGERAQLLDLLTREQHLRPEERALLQSLVSSWGEAA